MNKRQKEIMQAELDSEKKVLKDIEKVYKDSLNQINHKIEILLARKDADMQHVIYQVEYQRALKTQVQAILEQLQANEFETISEYLANSYQDGFLGIMYDMHGQGVPLILPIDQKQVLDAIQHETKLSESLYTTLGKDTKELQKEIANEISRGIASGLGYVEISRNISNYSNIPKNRAMTIARTESHRINCKARMDAMHTAKSKGADVVKQWDATLDGKTRSSHRELDGQIRELDEPFEVNGHKAMYPGGFGIPEEDVNCRCGVHQRAKWNLGKDELKILKERAAFFGLDKTKDLEDFKKRYMKAAEKERDRSSVQKMKTAVGVVVGLQKYTVGGKTYEVDGKHVVLDSKKHEKEVAELISDELGKEVQMVPRVVYPQNVSTPDYIIDGKKYDLKEPVGSGKHVLYNMINKKKSQADNFIFDISNCPLDYEAIKKQVDEIYSSSHTTFVNEIIIIKDGKVKEKFKRTK